jgi:hypothetical protein
MNLTAQDTNGTVIRCGNGHIIGVLNGDSRVQIRHAKREVFVEIGLGGYVVIRCEKCRREVRIPGQK